MLQSINVQPTNNGFIIKYKVKVDEETSEERTLVAITPKSAFEAVMPLLELHHQSIKGELEDSARISRIKSILHGGERSEEEEDL